MQFLASIGLSGGDSKISSSQHRKKTPGPIYLSGGDRGVSKISSSQHTNKLSNYRVDQFEDDFHPDSIDDIESQNPGCERKSRPHVNNSLNHNSVFIGDSITHVDMEDLNVLSIKLGMERTYFAAFNNAWIMAIAGIGLMSIGTNEASTGCGAIILTASIAFCLAAFVMHRRRAYIFLKKETGRTETILWMGMITFVSLAALILELTFGIMYPYLDRSKAVSVEGMQV